MEQDTGKNKKTGGSRFYAVLITLIAIAMTVANVMLIMVCMDKIDEIRLDNSNSNDNSSGSEDRTTTESLIDSNQKQDEENTESGENETIFIDSDLKTAQDVKDVVKSYMESGKGNIELLRVLYPEYIVVYDANRYVFEPVNDKLALNTVKNEQLKVTEDGEVLYTDKNGKVISKKGIDISKYQGDVNWDKVAKDGVEFVMLRVGYRGYGTGAIVLDEKFDDNVKGATKAGLKVGVYFFSQAISKEEAEEEAEFVLEHIKDYKVELPIVFDTEDIPDDSARTEGLTKKEHTQFAIAFCEKVKEAGYKPMIYASLKWFTLSLDMKELEDYEKWYAYYDTDLYNPYKFTMWQYSESGSVDGVEGKVDMNIWIEEKR